MRRIATLVIAVLVLTATACTPAQIRAFHDLNPEVGAAVTPETMNDTQRAVVAYLHEQQRLWLTAVAANADSGDCFVEMRKVFPSHAWDRMTKIIQRESGGDPRAQNPTSSAAGCSQTLKLHAPRYAKLGYSWDRDRYNARANIRVAHDLWLQAGWSPWALTAY